MKRKYLIIVLFLVIGLGSCKKFLDTEPTSFVTPVNFYSNLTQLQTALNSVYDPLTSGEAYFGPYGTDMVFRFAYTCDESTANHYAESQFNFDATSNAVRSVWSTSYSGIARANLLLANMDKADASEKDKNIIKGQALFLRGYFYYTLAICFGDVPLITEPTKSVTGDLSIARSPIKEVYAQVLSDMTTAETLLGNANFTVKSLGYAEKVTVDAVQGVLARVCLTMASPGASGTPLDASKYADVIKWTDKLINSPDHALNADYRQVFINMLQDKYDVKESIWEAGLYGTGSSEGSSFVFYNAIRNSPGGAQANSYITKKLYDSYSVWDSIRLNWNCPDFYYASRPVNFSPKTISIPSPWFMYPGKWRRIYESTFVGTGGGGQSSYNSCNVPILRLADVYLMKAEAENQLNGPTPAAYEAINAVRRRAFKVPTNVANAVCDLPIGLGKGDFMKEVKAERMRELCFEGRRKWDQLRWGSFIPDMQDLLGLAIATMPSGQTSNAIKTTLPRISQKHLLFPIPTLELQLNSKLTQNPGW